MNRADLHAYDLKIADAEARLDAAHADPDLQHMVPDIAAELATLKANREWLANLLAA